MPLYAISLCQALEKGHYKKALEHLANGLPANGDLMYRPLLSLSHRNPERALELARALVAAGADVNAEDHNGCRPLHHAIWMHDAPPAYLEFLLDQGADPYALATLARGSTESDALSACVRYRRPTSLKLLLDRGVLPLQPANKDPSAFSWALQLCNTEDEAHSYLYPLLQAGADLTEVDGLGGSVRCRAKPAAAAALDAWVKGQHLEATLPAITSALPKLRM